ncbi:FUSC family protein [Aeromicrobium wangtongii]|uniref:Integral membrane bound transporter domain-containing protein n=1 Tax=Aeromicrobium wangtongii TaxID=2969247 RepID=A0ABY5MAU0_9ACTN|nr:FUSC family protein [Aeromicrobium wangtongii]MCD9199761.1 hypothetical protein [Aeromicrobium wangtongii]UUP14110.1 hypothetical protein NQV15_02020 [Aeromicrobium wangtongii]
MAAGGKHLKKPPKGSPMLFALMLIVVVPAVVLADEWGAGSAGIIGGLTGLFSLVVFMGGSLRADLRVVTVMAPLLVFAAAVPRLVAESSRPAAIALVVLLGFVAALLPVLGPRFANAGMGLGMTTVFSYGYAPQGGADHRQVFAAAVAGVAVALALRLLMSAGDPSKPTREQVAEVLVSDDPTTATSHAFGMWLDDGRPRWLADVLDASSRYRADLHIAERSRTVPADDVVALHDRARRLSDQIKAKPGKKPADPEDAASPQAPVPEHAGLAAASRALDDIEQAVRQRDTTPVQIEHDQRHQLKGALLHPSDRVQSIQLRHALRMALGLLLMLIITSGLDRGDPLVSTVLLATFSILQASWRDTLTKATNKVIGVASGSIAAAVILLVVPERFLVAIAAVSLCLGLWYIVSRPALGYGFMVVVSVGFNAVSRDLDPVNLLLQYVGLTAAAVVVGLVVGFAVVPAFRAPPLRGRIQSATEATAAALRASSNGSAPARPDHAALQRQAVQKQEELVPDHDHLDDAQLDQLDRLRTSLQDLTALSEVTRLDPAALDRVVRALSPAGAPVPALDDGRAGAPAQEASSMALDLAQQAGDAERALLRTLPATV